MRGRDRGERADSFHPKAGRTTWGVWVAFAAALLWSAQPLFAQPLLDAASHPKFVDPLPIAARIDAQKGPKRFTVEMRETQQWLGLVDAEGDPLVTTVWGYGLRGEPATYPGPTFVAKEHVKVRVTWENALPPYGSGFPGLGGHLLPVDPSVHIAHPHTRGIPAVTHLHGGHTESASDGLPEAWFTQGFAETGPHFVKREYLYDNDQEAATLWYHDHALGITRLNVYAGLAGFYLLRDANEERLIRQNVLPGGAYEIEMAIQDRMFDQAGRLYVPSRLDEFYGPEELEEITYPEGQPSILPEFFGDFILVNGHVWPELSVEPRKYRFRTLNGSDSRFYVLELRDSHEGGTALPFYQIGTDNGFLPAPVPLTRLLLGPGERADLVVDFAGLPMGAEVYLRNFGPDEPFRGLNPDGTNSDGEGGALDPADEATTGQVMRFVVSRPLSTVPDATVGVGTQLRRRPVASLGPPATTRQLVLFEGLDQYGRLQPLLGTLEEGSLAWFDPITENPMVGDVEVWEVYNATMDAHPIHLHLVAFQILSRQRFEGEVEERPQPQHDGTFGVGGVLEEVELEGAPRGPEANEAGWKDTAVMLPGEVTRVVAKFDREGLYVWHCHILSHEDHEMMRPYYVGPMEAGRPALASAEPAPTLTLEPNWPNPFRGATEIRFHLPAASSVRLAVYDLTGREVVRLVDGAVEAGVHRAIVEGTGLASGVYVYRLTVGGETLARQMVLVR